MRRAYKYGLLFWLLIGMTLGAPVALPQLGGTAAAQAENNCLLALCSAGAGGDDEGEGGDATANGGNGGNGGRGGVATIHDVANVSEDASSSVARSNITTGDVIGPVISVDPSLGTNPVRAIAGSFPDTDVTVVAPDGGGNAQSGTTGGNGLEVDESGADGGDRGAARARGGNDDGTGGDDTGGDNVICLLVLIC